MANQIQSALTGTKTEQNLMTALDGESKAHTKYMLYSQRAKQEGYYDIARTWDEIAGQEKEHAELWLEYLDEIGDTRDNLELAAAGEEYEYESMYPEFARIAREEGFPEIAEKFERVGQIEQDHMAQYEKHSEDMIKDRIYEGSAETDWKCTNCGYRTKGNCPPERCPVCCYDKCHIRKMR